VIVEIDDPSDERVAAFRARDRQLAPGQPRRDAPEGLFVAEGDLVVFRALELGYQLHAVLSGPVVPTAILDAVPDEIAIFTASPPVRERLTGYGVQLDVIGLFHRKLALDLSAVLHRSQRIVVLEAVDNPVNLGVIARTAAGLGFDALVLSETSADPYARRAVRTSMGATLALPSAVYTDLHQLVGFTTVALTPDESAVALHLLSVRTDERVALLLGEERAGLRPATMAAADHRVRIPMHRGVDSLNVAAAAAIACYHLRPR
jgi:tRNA G18 (ribose-2'-O)-methylase SpoU